MLEGFGGDCRNAKKDGFSPAHSSKSNVTCYHVNARVSLDMEAIGRFYLRKPFPLVAHCLSAIWCRFRYGTKILYYIPAPGKPSAVLRDWMVMFLCRPFFPQIVLHWHAAGLSKWLETSVPAWVRSVTVRLMKNADLSIILSEYNRPDAEMFSPKNIALVPNGIPDPCSDFEKSVFPRRVNRAAARKKVLSGRELNAEEKAASGDDPQIFKVLFLAHCTRAKGLFDTLDGVARANQTLASSNSPMRIRLSVAGAFFDDKERAEFDERIKQSDLSGAICYENFVTGAEKSRLFTDSDCFCFPTYYYAESFGLVLVEAMAFGLPIVASRWRAIPEIMPKSRSSLVEPRDVAGIADALLAKLSSGYETEMRRHFLENFTLNKHLENLSAAFRRVK